MELTYSALKEAETLSLKQAYQLAILNGLQGKPVYQGTVPAHVKARRRAANKVARASRRKNR